MRIIIIGAGTTGKNLAGRLCSVGHDVIIVDNNPETLANIDSEIDVLAVEGDGSTPGVLQEAEVAKADLVAAVTSRDEVNILACCWARNAGVKHTIARISDKSYMESPLADLEKLGVDYAVSQHEHCAQEIFNVFCLPGTIEVANLLGGRVAAVGFKVPAASPLLGKPLKEFWEEPWFRKVRFIGHVHNRKLDIPCGDSCCAEGDAVYVVLTPDEASPFIDWALGGPRPGFRKVVIVGGSDLGLALAELLETASFETIVIERDPDRAHYVSEKVNNCMVVNADATKAAVLKEFGMDSGTALAALTDDDEMNIICCMQAKQLGVGSTIARIDKPEYVPIIDNFEIVERIVSPYLSLIREILRCVHGESVINVGLFHRISGELQEIAIRPGSKWIGKRLSKARLPSGMIIAAVQRHDETFVPTGNFVFRENDLLAVYCLQKTAHKVRSIFK